MVEKGEGRELWVALDKLLLSAAGKKLLQSPSFKHFAYPLFSLSALFFFADARNEHEAGLHFWADPSAPTPDILS